MKKIFLTAILLLLCASVAGCNNGKNQPDENTPSDSTIVESNPNENNESQEIEIPEHTDNRLENTYWHATGHYSYFNKDTLVEWNYSEGDDSRFADIYFDADGNALFRDVQDGKYMYTKHYVWTDDGEIIYLENKDKNDWGNEFFAQIRDGVLYFEAFECILRMEKAERPVYGSEYCKSDFIGKWKLSQLSSDSGFVSADSKSVYSVMDFDIDASDKNVMYASYLYEEDGKVTVDISKTPIIDTQYEDLRFASEDGNLRYEASVKDENTLTVTAYDHSDGQEYRTIRTMIYKKYSEKEQHRDLITRLEEKYDRKEASLKTNAEKEACAYEEFMEWDVLLNSFNARLKKTLPNSQYENIKVSQIAWVLNRSSAMEKASKPFADTEGENIIKYNKGSDYTKEKCLELLEYIK